MPPRKKKKTRSAVLKKIEPVRPLDPLRTGMPALDSIVDVKEFRRGKRVYRMIQTNEVDEYESPPTTKRKGQKKR